MDPFVCLTICLILLIVAGALPITLLIMSQDHDRAVIPGSDEAGESE